MDTRAGHRHCPGRRRTADRPPATRARGAAAPTRCRSATAATTPAGLRRHRNRPRFRGSESHLAEFRFDFVLGATTSTSTTSRAGRRRRIMTAAGQLGVGLGTGVRQRRKVGRCRRRRPHTSQRPTRASRNDRPPPAPGWASFDARHRVVPPGTGVTAIAHRCLLLCFLPSMISGPPVFPDVARRFTTARSFANARCWATRTAPGVLPTSCATSSAGSPSNTLRMMMSRALSLNESSNALTSLPASPRSTASSGPPPATGVSGIVS